MATKKHTKPSISKASNAPKRILVDTSVVIDGRISENFLDRGVEVLIPRVVVQELEHQANLGRSTGRQGLDELARLREMSRSKRISLAFVGEVAEEVDIRNSYIGRIDAIIRDLAGKYKATLVTSDKTQATVAQVYGIPLIYYEPLVPKEKEQLLIEEYFDDKTMSVHLKEGVEPYAKRGEPGEWKMVKVGGKKISSEEIAEIVDELVEEAKRKRGFIEIDKRGCTVIQLGPYRIVITQFPFSDSTEITAVRPIKSLTLKDYNISEKLKKRLEKRAEGILVVGPPGAGKSTFAQALAQFYAQMGKTVKTMEHPRDLQVPREITQYAPLDGSMKNTGDILLLVRPDYTIYDEVRKPQDFLIFEDLRLAGVGMIGVTHAAAPIDAIQRFVGKVELGVIPQVVDTLIFIEKGKIGTVYTLNMNVRVPTGMTEQDLARPIVEVKNFDSGALEYEIYTYGEEVVVIPVREVAAKQKREFEKISEGLSNRILSYVPSARIENVGKSVNVFVPQREMKRIIGRAGKTVSGIEREFGVTINVLPLSPASGIPTKTGRKQIHMDLGRHNADQYVKIYANDEYLFTAVADSDGVVSIKRRTKNGKKLLKALESGKKLRYEVVI